MQASFPITLFSSLEVSIVPLPHKYDASSKDTLSSSIFNQTGVLEAPSTIMASQPANFKNGT